MNLECLRLLRQEPVTESVTRLDFTILPKRPRTRAVANPLALHLPFLRYLLLPIRLSKRRQAKRMLTGLVSDDRRVPHTTSARRLTRDPRGPNGTLVGH